MSEISLCPQNSLQNQFTSSAKLKPDFQFLAQQTYFISDFFYVAFPAPSAHTPF